MDILTLKKIISEEFSDDFISQINIYSKENMLVCKSGWNILHEMAISSRPILTNYSILIKILSPETIKEMLNKKSNNDEKMTPFQLSIINYKKVIST